MRKISPILVVLAAVTLYAARGTLLGPFIPDGPRDTHIPGGQLQTAGTMSLPGNAIDPAAATLDQPEPVAPIEGKISKNSSLYVEMRKMDISPVEIDKVARASRKTFNLKKVRPGQEFLVYASPEHEVDSLVFFINREQCLKIRRLEDEFTAVVDTIPYTVTYHVTQGTIRHSVFASLLEQNAETELAGSLDEIFGWTIDFITDIRAGDTFAVLYERKTFNDGESTLGNVLAAKVVTRGHEHFAFRFKTQKGNTGYYDPEGRSLQKSLRRAPLKYSRVTSNFSGRRFHPVNQRYQPHWGVDYGAPRGTPIHATGDGTVVAATRRAGNGNYVKIKHNNTYTTYYLHMSRFARGIRSGVRVKQGQLIGYVGSTGSATGPHVCYRIKKNGKWVNPRKLKLPSKNPVPKTDMVSFERLRDSYLLRMTESILADPDDKTRVVESPQYPANARIQTVF
jgi:murein DD-endopeptidase MepM/ murein hydrolase activator NlpD